MKIVLLLLALLLAPAMARADDVDDAAAICAQHHGPRVTTQPWEPGWEHCQKIIDAKVRRDQQRAMEDEAKNPALKATRELSRKLEQMK